MDISARHLAPLSPYDPQYDPLVAPQPGARHRLRADLLGRHRRRAAARRRPDHCATPTPTW